MQLYEIYIYIYTNVLTVFRHLEKVAKTENTIFDADSQHSLKVKHPQSLEEKKKYNFKSCALYCTLFVESAHYLFPGFENCISLPLNTILFDCFMLSFLPFESPV